MIHLKICLTIGSVHSYSVSDVKDVLVIRTGVAKKVMLNLVMNVVIESAKVENLCKRFFMQT